MSARHATKHEHQLTPFIVAVAVIVTVLGFQAASASVPTDQKTVGRVDTCVTDSIGGCTIEHGYGEKPTAIAVTASGTDGFALAVVNPANTTATSYTVTFFRFDGSRWVNTAMSFNALLSFGPPPPPDTTAPDTLITTSPPASTEDASAVFNYTASEVDATFECRLDTASFGPCTSPTFYEGLSVGQHSFEVRATDLAGNVDASPASYVWDVLAPPLRPSWQTTGTPLLTFQDEFNDTTVDTSKWELGWFKASGLSDNINFSNDNCYHSNQVSESGGYLHLVAIAQANTCKGVVRPYTSGIVTTRTKFTQHFGSFEARVCLPDADNNGLVDNFPAWWVNGMASGFTDGEIDVVEGLGGGNTKATVHYDPSHISAGKTSPTPLTGCHNFGAEWRGNNMRFYWDSVLFFDTPFVTPSSAQLVLIFNQAVDDSHSPTVVPPGGNDMKVDWVHVFA
jgi:hypothetical protein